VSAPPPTRPGRPDASDDADADLGDAADRWVAEMLASLPPPTERQLARIRAILSGEAS
jgi:hypothetical protein